VIKSAALFSCAGGHIFATANGTKILEFVELGISVPKLVAAVEGFQMCGDRVHKIIIDRVGALSEEQARERSRADA